MVSYLFVNYRLIYKINRGVNETTLNFETVLKVLHLIHTNGLSYIILEQISINI